MERTKHFLVLLCLLTVMFPTRLLAQQQGKNVNLKCSNMPLATALYKVEQQSGYYKMNFNSDDLKAYNVTAVIKEAKAPAAVELLLKGLPFASQVKGRIIYVNRHANASTTARGRLIGADGEPLVGATVKVVGSQVGVITDADGNYTINNVSADDILEYSYLGMKTYRRKVSSKPVNIMLEADDYTLDDVMVTGYQTLKRENATGAFQTVSSKELDERYTASLTDRLEGKIAGLVNYGDQMTIRGVGTLKASSSPLVVVDGLPINGTLEDVNPYDIEKVTVLKDAAAAAIYGARASNGVIVVVTKKATKEKLSVEFNADVTTQNKLNYDDLGYCNAEELIELAQYNFDWITKHQDAYDQLFNNYTARGGLMDPITPLMIRHKEGQVSDEEYNRTISQWSKNSYRTDWQDLMEHNRLQQQYNLSLRTKGKYLNSSIIINWKGDNTQMKDQYDNTLSLQYNGVMDVTKWLNLDFGVTLNNNRKKSHVDGDDDPSGITDFAEYLSMYNADGTPASLKAYVDLNEPTLSDPALGLKSEAYIPLTDLNLNFNKNRQTYTRSFIHVNVTPIPELKLSGMFQYEDISGHSESLFDADSYFMRHQYNLFTSGGVHYLPEGGMLDQSTTEGNYYTFRAQATFDKTFAEKHSVSAIAGFEYRQAFTRGVRSRLYGYDDQTLTNNTGLIDFSTLNNLKSSDLGPLYSPQYAFIASLVADVDEVKHRYESYYFTANYTYDKRYSVSGSYRVDKADLFGADPEFRSRPLWSVGASWNAHNEAFLKDLKWLDMLKVRASYGVTGNINSNYSSYLTASMDVSNVHGEKYATLNTPPNDQLRWEKTTTWNVGIDFAVLDHRLTGSFDVYRKKGSDILSSIDLDPTTGWTSLYTNNAETENKGVELQLSADILRAKSDNEVGISADLTLAYNRNKILKINHEPTSGYKALSSFREGDPINSLYSFAFDHVATDENGYQQIYWRKANGEVLCDDLYNSSFTKDDIVYSGSLDPKFSGSFTPTVTWQGFSLGGVFVFYTGHYFRANAQAWNTSISLTYDNATPKSFLDYWRTPESEREGMLGNGYMMSLMYVSPYNTYYNDQNVDHADYLKLRSLVLGYSFTDRVCRSLGIQSLRLRLQMNNVFTSVRNSAGVDPESVNPLTGELSPRTPKSYTLSLNVKF